MGACPCRLPLCPGGVRIPRKVAPPELSCVVPSARGCSASFDQSAAGINQPAVSEHEDELLVELEQEERRLSAKRRRLQARMDFLQSGGDGFAQGALERLESLRQVESELSRQRRELHARIDDLRAAAGLPAYRDERAIRERLSDEG